MADSPVTSQESPYYFGWQPSPPDFRDYQFTAQPTILTELPPAIDLSSRSLPAPWLPVFDQGQLGSCGAQTAAADIIHAGLAQQNLPSMPMPSRLAIYYWARLEMGTVDQDSGVYNRALLKALNKYGWCDESLYPHDISRFRNPPSQAATQQAATRKIKEYLAVPQQLEQMKACLAGGDPIIFGFAVYSSMMTQEVQRTGRIPLPSMSDRQIGGHDVLLVGYEDSTQLFKFRNSWGGWGTNGYGWIPYSYATNPRLAGDFWTVQHSALPDPTPPPPPPPPPGPTTASVRVTFGDGTVYSGTLTKDAVT